MRLVSIGLAAYCYRQWPQPSLVIREPAIKFDAAYICGPGY
jgi:hypothetical protein